MRKIIGACAVALFVAAGLYGQDAAASTIGEIDENDLFGDESAGIETIAESAEGKATAVFLKTESVRVGGSFSGLLSPSWTWNDPWNGSFDAADPDAALLSPEVGAKVFFEARPDEETRFYGSFKTEWPFNTSSGSADIPNIEVFELFADRSWHDTLFFRFGKHTVKWGVGYFWSPADVVNLTSIDVSDPEAQLEGPVSLRLHVPIIGTQNNVWAYAIVPDTDNAAELSPSDLGFAAKYEFLVGNYEIGTGAFLQADRAPKAMLTATGAVWKFNLFGEAVMGWGSDKAWVESIDVANQSVTTSKDDEDLYFSGTAGFSYVDSGDDVTATFQYFYNGDGYSTSRREDLIAEGRAAIDTLSAAGTDAAMSAAFKGLIYQSGLHYAGASLTKSELLGGDLSLGLLAVANLSDLSGFVQPTATYEFFDGFSASLSPSFYWAADVLWGSGADGEYVILADGPAVTLKIKAVLGSGKF